MSMRIGIDVGGTFTDFLVVTDDGDRLLHKTSSVTADPARAVARGLEEIAARHGRPLDDFLADVDTIVHGTTVTTNALLTRTGARTGLLGTQGFRDVLPMRDGTREEAYNNRCPQPVPLVERALRQPVRERIDHRGQEVAPLEAEDVRQAARLFAAEGVEAVAISFMHSHAEPTHERAAAEVLREELPDAYVTRSSELLPQVRYYPRTSTAVLNSYVGPTISRYLETLTALLEKAGFGGHLLIMQSNGGVATSDTVSARAALSLLSGPASGPTAGLRAVAEHDWQDCITIDMGGTSFDAAAVRGGKPLVMTDGMIDGWSLALPMIDIHTIGAGGGSIAAVDEGGMLRVGPQSAGAEPGPACYQRGGQRATVTDADLVLGYLSPDNFLVGEMQLSVDRAREAIDRDVAKPLGIDIVEAAAGIYELVNVNMATGIRQITVSRGLDPRDFPLVVAGGAGPVHAAAIAHELSIPAMVAPRESSIFCAAGMLVCDFKHDYVQSHKTRLDALEVAAVQGVWGEMAHIGLETLQGEGVDESAVTLEPSLDLRYAGQWYELNVTLPAKALRDCDPDEVAERFHDLHDLLFGYRTYEMPIDVLNVRLRATGTTPKMPWDSGLRPEDLTADPVVGERPVWSTTRRRLVPAQVYDGARLGPGSELPGPGIVELGTTTVVVPDEYDLLVDDAGSFVLLLRDRAVELRRRVAGATGD